MWIDHFDWNNDSSQVIDKTPCGRAIVAALHLNRIGITNLRRLLPGNGLHPPLYSALGIPKSIPMESSRSWMGCNPEVFRVIMTSTFLYLVPPSYFIHKTLSEASFDLQHGN